MLFFHVDLLCGPVVWTFRVGGGREEEGGERRGKGGYEAMLEAKVDTPLS